MHPPSLPRGWLVAVVLLHLLPLAARPAMIGGDEPHYALAAHSLATDGDLRLADDYAAVEAGAAAAGRKRAGEALDRHLIDVDGRQVFSHPIGLPLLAAPLLAVQQAVAPGSAPDLLLLLLTSGVTLAALLAAWRLARERWGTRTASLVVLGGYFSSPLWYYSRTFFTEPWTWALAVLAGVCLVRRRVLAAALLLALTLAMKETALLLVLPILLVTWRLRGPRTAALAALGPAAFAVFFVAKNLVLTGRPLATFQPFQLGDPWAGALGLLADPARGLVWFAPWLLAGLTGFWVRGPRGGLRTGDDQTPGRGPEGAVGGAARTAAGPPSAGPAASRQTTFWLLAGAGLAFAGYFAISAAWVDWRGGTGYGSRLLLPALPALALPLARLCGALSPRPLAALFGVLASFGFAVNLSAAVDPVAAMWDATVGGLIAGQPVAFGAGLVLGLVATWAWCLRPSVAPGTAA